MNLGSPQFKLDVMDLKSNAIIALLVGAGATLTYLLEWVQSSDFGSVTPVVVVAATWLIDLALKWAKDNRKRFG